MTEQTDFHGAKVALFVGQRLLVALRDDRPDIPWPGYWDLPGGGREGNETPEETVIRETYEEFALCLTPEVLTYRRAYPMAPKSDVLVWFFAAHVPESWEQTIVFGEEGQDWGLWPVERFLTHPRAVPIFVKRLHHYLENSSYSL